MRTPVSLSDTFSLNCDAIPSTWNLANFKSSITGLGKSEIAIIGLISGLPLDRVHPDASCGYDFTIRLSGSLTHSITTFSPVA